MSYVIDREWILSGKAIFTVSNDKGTRYTYRVTHKAADGRFPEAYFVSLLTGPDNTSDYSYMGMVNKQTAEVFLTRKSAYNDDSVPVKVVRWALKKIWANEAFPVGYAVCHEGYCGRCSRLLTVPSSVESGYGPECIQLVARERRKQELVGA